jgi:hypothetical protein
MLKSLRSKLCQVLALALEQWADLRRLVWSCREEDAMLKWVWGSRVVSPKRGATGEKNRTCDHIHKRHTWS